MIEDRLKRIDPSYGLTATGAKDLPRTSFYFSLAFASAASIDNRPFQRATPNVNK